MWRWTTQALLLMWYLAGAPARAVTRLRHTAAARTYERQADKLERQGLMWTAQQMRELAAARRGEARRHREPPL